METPELNNNYTSSLLSIYIVKDGIKFELLPWQNKGSDPFESLSFVESINTTSMGGYLMIKDVYAWSKELNVHSFETLGLKFMSKYPSKDTSIDIKTIEFNIFNVSQITNRPMRLQMNNDETYTIIRFDFTTEDLFAKNIDGQLFPPEKDFVGFISTDDDTGEIKGLVNLIFNKLGINNFEIEGTHNGIWIKSNEISYPWAKNKGQISINSLLQYVCNYAASKTNPNAVNYFLWRDSNGYYFKSVEKMITDQKDADFEKIYFSTSSGLENTVRNIQQMHEPNILHLANINVFQSFYEKVVPNYDEFYLDFIDSSLAYSNQIIDIDYNKDHVLWKKIEQYKIIPDTRSTSIYLEKLNNPEATTKNTPVQSVRIDDNIYGYYDSRRLNTPFPQSWDYIGKTADSRWNDVNFVPQYDMTDLNLQTFHTIQKKIREPLREKRKQYSYLKNLKRKWEVYRCSVCCLSDRLGGIQDQIDITNLQGIENPNDNQDFKLLFGATGIFSEFDVQYNIAAAGSFSDVFDYDSTKANAGLSLSYDLNSAPFNESIRDFYYFKQNFENYEKHIFTNAFKEYDLRIGEHQKEIQIIDEWLASVDSYIQAADVFYNQNLQDKTPDEDIGPYLYGNQLFYDMKPPRDKYFDNPESNGAVLPFPEWIFECSKQKYLPVSVSQYTITETDYYISNKPSYIPSNTYFSVFTETPAYISVNQKATDNYNQMISDVNNKTAACTMCMNSVSMEILKRRAKKQKIYHEQNIVLLQNIKTTFQQKFKILWDTAIEQYMNRKAFFISKRETKIENNADSISTPLSLFNVKSIKRKAVRGSRYEILARNKGITGAEVGPYLHSIFFDDDPNNSPDIDGNHPYYDQSYKGSETDSAFKANPRVRKNILTDDYIRVNDPPFTSRFGPTVGDFVDSSKIPLLFEADPDNSFFIRPYNTDIGYSNNILRSLNRNGADISDFETRFDLFDQSIIQNKKPPNIKREEISSYVRVEFKQPIGLESMADFPDGFVRNAGYEYFLPYIVSLTAGPNGRQTIKQNVVVIGMDPYGFDVAMKRIPDQKQDGEYYWWSSGLDSPQMDLWPEVAFETRYPYYISHYSDSSKYSSPQDIFGFSKFNTDVVGLQSLQTLGLNYGMSSYPSAINSDNLGFKINPVFSGYDYNLRNTDNASGFLTDSHKVAKASRNWWSFHIPENILIVPWFESLQTQFYSGGVDYGDGNGLIDDIKLFSNEGFRNNTGTSYFYRSSGEESYYNNHASRDYDTSLKFSESDDLFKFLDVFNTNDIRFHFEEHHSFPKVSVFKENFGFFPSADDIFGETHPDIKQYFANITNWWMTGDHMIYRNGLVSEDVWKYDLSGYSDYGMIFPPVRSNHCDIFDNNFAAQFVVFAKTTGNLCKKNNLKCINPNGPVTTSGCPESNPYCNCPAQNRKPSQDEPSYLTLYKLEQELKECSLIQEHLGEDWLGCVWSNPDNTASCNCPEIGDKFMEYLEYSRTYATFWNTPAKTPLLRNTQYNLLFSQTLQVEIPRNDNIKIGSIVLVEDYSETGTSKYKRFGGKWLVTEITNIFYGQKDFMSVTLNRDSFNSNPNETNTPTSVNSD